MKIKTAFLGLMAMILLFVAIPKGKTQTDPDPEPIGTHDVKVRPGAVKLTPAQVDSLAKVDAARLAQAAKPVAQLRADTSAIVDYNNPDSFIKPNAVGLLEAGLYALIAFLGGFIPGVRQWAASTKGAKFITSGIAIFVVVAVVATFRQGAFTEGVVQFALDKFLPSFAYSGLVYNLIKFIIGLLPKRTVTEVTG